MQIIYKKVSDLIPYVNNSRTHSEMQVNQICASINEFGFTNPLLIDEKDNIIAGHGRLLASKKLNMEEVPCIVLEGLTEAQKKAYIIADNKMALNAGWDEELLKIELENLKELNFDLELTGFDIDELDDILGIDEEEKEVEEDDFEIEVPEEPKAKLGDIYQLGNHRLMCGSSTNIEMVNKLLDGNDIDLVYSDPPYGINIVNDKGKVGAENLAKNKTYLEVKGDDTTDTANEFYNTCVALGIDKFILWGGNYFTEFLPFSASWLIWDKRIDMNSNNFADGEMAWCSFKTPVRIYHQLWNGMIREGEHEDRVHPTQKPIRMQTEILNDFSNENDKIYDGFGGSGSTLIACEKTNRQCFMMEYEPHYVDVIINRWEQFTGNKAVLLNEGENK